MIKGAFISEEVAKNISGALFENGRFNPVQDEDGRWFVSVVEGAYLEDVSIELLYRYTFDAQMNRASIMVELKSEADAFPFEIDQKAFFNENKAVIDFWLMNGGYGLKELFETSEYKWLDIRADEESPSPREYALNLL